MVEFVLVLPLLLMIMFAVVQFGVVYHDYITLTDATRAGARKGIVSANDANPAALAEAAVRDSASGLDQGDLDVIVSATGWETGNDVTVEATYPYDIDILGVTVASGNLSSETTERVE